MKWLRNKSFLILLTGLGLLYLSFVDHWQVYAEPLAQLKDRCLRNLYGEPALSENVTSGEREDGLYGVLTQNEEEGTGKPDAEAQGALSDGEGASGDKEHTASAGEDGSGAAGEPVYMTVEDDYFSDALFIGDSRTVGMYEYGGLEDITTFYASTGLTVYKLFDAQIAEVPGQRKKQTVEEALRTNRFQKIYLMVGINEMGTGTVESFAEKYGEVVDHLLELQPDAILYIQGIMKVTTERSLQGDYINNEGIEARNEAIARLADNERIFYLDVNPLLCDDTGGMEPSYTFDGVHLKAQYIDIWKDFLKSHAVQREKLMLD